MSLKLTDLTRPIEEAGHGVKIQYRKLIMEDGHVVSGVAYWHDCPKGHHGGYANLNGPDPWTLISEDPLTISPSLLCPACGHHGFVRDSKWVPA